MSLKNAVGEFLEEVKACRKQLDQRAKRARNASELQSILEEIDFIKETIFHFRSACERTGNFQYRLNRSE
ncbi:MAG: hypothetical protein LBE89_02155 [Helicobacteraceae bacterium]|jgi:hypothetical protein|nr:hypothetical protein [Helicobacteraceae bacterium]